MPYVQPALANVNKPGAVLQVIWVLADFDGDYDVDSTDIQHVYDNLGMSNATRDDGDLDGNGLVNGADYLIAQLMQNIRLLYAT